MLSKQLLLIILFTSVVFSQTNSNNNYFPLDDNLSREYIMPGANGNNIPVTENIVSNGKQYSIERNMKMGNINVNTIEVYEVRANGIFEIASGGGMFSSEVEKHKSPYPFIKYPIKNKSKWSYTEDGGREIKREVIAFLNECDVNSKIYNDVLKIKHTIVDGNRIISKYEYYANGVGLIKEEMEDGKLFKYLVE